MVAMTPACLVTTLTTAAGFGSLVSATIPTIQAFGAYVALAIVFAFVAQMLMIPIMLSLLPAPRRPPTPIQFSGATSMKSTGAGSSE